MMDRLLRALDRKDPRLPPLIAFLFVLFLLIECWVLVLRKPFQQYQLLSETSQNLVLSIATRGGPSNELANLQTELNKLKSSLDQELKLVRSSGAVVAPLLEKIDASAQANGLRLSSVTPGERKNVLGFEERPFFLVITGEYLAIAHWLQKLHDAVGQNVVVTSFEIKSTSKPKILNMNMSIALYLPRSGDGTP